MFCYVCMLFASLKSLHFQFLQSDAGKYLQSWAQKMKYPKPVVKAPRPRPGDVPNLEDSLVELVKNSKVG